MGVPPGKRAWPMRHRAWSGPIAIAVLLAAVAGCASGNGSKSAALATANPTPRPSATSAGATASLVCQAGAVIWRPADHTIAKIRVRTVAGAQVSASGPLAWLHGGGAAIRAKADGTRTLRFQVGNATPGSLVVITVRVSGSGSTGSCRARLRPRPGVVTAVAPAQQATPAPTTPSPTTPPPAPQPAATCYPISDEGTCYEPGEFCRDDDHGMTGLAGDGETIVCEDNDGWRWEPV